MPGYQAPSLSALTDWFNRLPGIGKKTAQRLAYFVMSMPQKDAEAFASAIIDARRKIHRCAKCCNLTDDDLCPICKSAKRDKTTVCVVETPKDIASFEKMQEYSASYHVLHGVISPLSGTGPDQLTIKELVKRINEDNVKEVIMATNATAEGETTAVYIAKLLKPLGVKVTRLAYGIPVGGDLEYADEVTLSRALEGRCEI